MKKEDNKNKIRNLQAEECNDEERGSRISILLLILPVSSNKVKNF
jgi:hypothetical protein